MPDTTKNIALPANQWIDLYATSGVEVGVRILAENLTDKPVRLYAGATPPPLADEDSDQGYFSRLMGYSEKINDDGDLGAWALAEVTGLINIKVLDMSWKSPTASLFSSSSPADAMTWAGDFITNTTYSSNQVSLQDGWLGVSLVDDNIDPIAPQPKGSQFYIYDGVIPADSATATQVVFGCRYSIPEALFIEGYRVYTIAGNDYSIYTVKDPDGAAEINLLVTFTASQTGWVETGLVPRIIEAGSEFDLIAIASEPDPTPTETTLSYNYLTPNNSTTPANGQIIHANRDVNFLLVSKNDQNADQSVFLSTLTIGDIIDGTGESWAIQSILDQGGHYRLGIAPATQGSPDGVQDFIFTTKTATDITYAKDIDYNISNPNVKGLYTETGGILAVLEDNNQYGVDLLIREANVSDTWARMAYSLTNSSFSALGNNGTGGLSNGMPTTPNDGDLYLGKFDGWVKGFNAAPINSFVWSTDTTATAPGQFTVKGNNADPALISEIYVDITSLDGQSMANVTTFIGVGDALLFSKFGERDKYFNVLATMKATDNTGWYTIPVIPGSIGGLLQDGDIITVDYSPIGARSSISMIAGTGYAVSTNSLAPSNLQSLSTIGVPEGLLLDPADGSVRNVTGRTITMTGSLSLQGDVTGGGTPQLQLASARSSDKVSWTYNQDSHREFEMSSGNETVLNTTSFFVSVNHLEYVKFTCYATGGGISLTNRTASFEGQSVSGFTILWSLKES